MIFSKLQNILYLQNKSCCLCVCVFKVAIRHSLSLGSPLVNIKKAQAELMLSVARISNYRAVTIITAGQCMSPPPTSLPGVQDKRQREKGFASLTTHQYHHRDHLRKPASDKPASCSSLPRRPWGCRRRSWRRERSPGRDSCSVGQCLMGG